MIKAIKKIRRELIFRLFRWTFHGVRPSWFNDGLITSHFFGGKNDLEFQALSDEITRIANETEYNGMHILDGSFTGNTLQIGFDSGANQQLTFSISNVAEDGLEIATDNLQSMKNSRTAIDNLDASIGMVDVEQSKLVTAQDQIQFAISNLTSARQNMSQLTQGADYVLEAAELAKNQILTQSGTAILTQASVVSQNVLNVLR